MQYFAIGDEVHIGYIACLSNVTDVLTSNTIVWDFLKVNTTKIQNRPHRFRSVKAETKLRQIQLAPSQLKDELEMQWLDQFVADCQ